MGKKKKKKKICKSVTYTCLAYCFVYNKAFFLVNLYWRIFFPLTFWREWNGEKEGGREREEKERGRETEGQGETPVGCLPHAP